MDGELVSIFICVVLPVAILFLVYYYRDRANKERLNLISKAIDKGVEISPELLEDQRRRQPEASGARKNYAMLTWGICLALFGIASFILLYFLLLNATNFYFGIACVGFIPALVGVGLIISFYMGRYYDKKDAIKE